MTWLIAIICIILAIAFWRIFVPLAIIAAVGLGLLLLYFQGESARSERKRQLEEQAVRQRIANSKATARDIVREWDVSAETDPASGEKVPRYASVLSDDGLCRLQVEERINRTRLASIYCSGLKISSYSDIEVKFDNRSTSDTMKIQKFSNGDDVYIPSYQYRDHLSYDEFLRRTTGANKVAFLLTVEGAGQHWITFSLAGSSPALTKIGALPLGSSSDTAKSATRKSPQTRGASNSDITPHLPANAKLNTLGNDWECVRGYRRSGNECVVVQIPPKAELNILGHDWQCVRGYRRSGNECVEVQIPVNAKLNILGNDWECVRGYRRSGNECVVVQIPPNAELNILGHDWQCVRGYRRAGNECVPVFASAERVR